MFNVTTMLRFIQLTASHRGISLQRQPYRKWVAH